MTEADVSLLDRAARRRLTPRQEAVNDELRRLLAAGLDLLRRNTAALPRVSDIVAAANSSNDAFYRAFGSREAFLAVVVDDGLRRLLAEVRAARRRRRRSREAGERRPRHRPGPGARRRRRDHDARAAGRRSAAGHRGHRADHPRRPPRRPPRARARGAAQPGRPARRAHPCPGRARRHGTAPRRRHGAGRGGADLPHRAGRPDDRARTARSRGRTTVGASETAGRPTVDPSAPGRSPAETVGTETAPARPARPRPSPRR